MIFTGVDAYPECTTILHDKLAHGVQHSPPSSLFVGKDEKRKTKKQKGKQGKKKKNGWDPSSPFMTISV